MESYIKKRKVDLKPIEEVLGMNPTYTRGKPVIPGKFDLIIPPGTPRKLIIELAKEYNLDVIQRDDRYVTIGVSDIPRELLCIRGDKATVEKMEKILLQRLKAWAS